MIVLGIGSFLLILIVALLAGFIAGWRVRRRPARSHQPS